MKGGCGSNSNSPRHHHHYYGCLTPVRFADCWSIFSLPLFFTFVLPLFYLSFTFFPFFTFFTFLLPFFTICLPCFYLFVPFLHLSGFAVSAHYYLFITLFYLIFKPGVWGLSIGTVLVTLDLKARTKIEKCLCGDLFLPSPEKDRSHQPKPYIGGRKGLQ